MPTYQRDLVTSGPNYPARAGAPLLAGEARVEFNAELTLPVWEPGDWVPVAEIGATVAGAPTGGFELGLRGGLGVSRPRPEYARQLRPPSNGSVFFRGNLHFERVSLSLVGELGAQVVTELEARCILETREVRGWFGTTYETTDCYGDYEQIGRDTYVDWVGGTGLLLSAGERRHAFVGVGVARQVRNLDESGDSYLSEFPKEATPVLAFMFGIDLSRQNRALVFSGHPVGSPSGFAMSFRATIGWRSLGREERASQSANEDL